MNKPLFIQRNKYNNIFFASDFHFNHQRDFIWKPRGLDSYQAHDRFLEEQCSNLKENDLLIYLGDFSLNSSAEQTKFLFNKIKCPILYCSGNHEGEPSKLYKEALKQVAPDFPPEAQIFPLSFDINTRQAKVGINYAKGITFFGEEGYFRIGNNHYFCRHFAPLIWDKMKYDNFFAICGHSHGNLPIATPFNTKDGKILDVGVDNCIKYNNTAFLSIEEVDKIMETKKIRIHDHHGDAHV